MTTSTLIEKMTSNVDKSTEINYTEANAENFDIIVNTSGCLQVVRSVSTSRTSGEVKLRLAPREMTNRLPDHTSR